MSVKVFFYLYTASVRIHWRWGALLLLFLVFTGLSYIHVYARHTKMVVGDVDIYQHLGIMNDYEAYLSAITQGQHGFPFFRNPYSLNNPPYLPHYFGYVLA